MELKGKPIYRSREHRQLGGVCGGIAEWAGWDPVLVRVTAVLLTVFTGFLPGLVAYVALLIVIPVRDDSLNG
jgi:phage shock protein C